MATDTQLLSAQELERFSSCPVRCPRLRQKIVSLPDYLALISNSIRTEDTFWFRGNDDVVYSLTPSALRPSAAAKRERALALIAEFKRIAAIKMLRPPAPSAELEWALIAQHHGLPTRLLDWTESATTALYFACRRCPDRDGIVYIINPIALNRLTYPGKPRVLDPQQDSAEILSYLRMGARRLKAGRYPVAINPVWNSERLMMQKGVFTLHGGVFDLDTARVPSLVGIPILREAKPLLIAELGRIGVDEMTLFPELEHACAHLKRKAGLGET